ncbi:hypothetical protein D9756_002947 [Leucocoprinus leucothites]|uniref:Major facilitator superfamily (MFS) profile domain-containing protein n=1 Tax=Leucocoprinus leucothites TaxID=201217 RepID=A0A8H5LK04_9AGAR|nr:hypothetical protein D9756_002947 [Leucoagaricus leucothites]
MSSTISYMDEEKRLDELHRRVLRKLDWNVIPCLSFLWLANFIDRSNIGNARIAGLEKDLRLQGTEFNVGLAAFFIAYIVVEIPANLLLKKVKANRWLPIFTCAWGLSTLGTGFAKDFSGLVAARFFLGFCEGSLFPCMILYMSTLYPRHKLQFRMGSFYSAGKLILDMIKSVSTHSISVAHHQVSMSGAFGGLLAAAILKMDGVGGIAGWRWIFILEGAVTVAFGMIAAIILPADLSSARFLSEEERMGYIRFYTRKNPHAFAFAVESTTPDEGLEKKESLETTPTDSTAIVEGPGQNDLKNTSAVEEDEVFEWREVRRGLFDFQTWVTGIVFFANIVAIYSFSLFLPTIVLQLGFEGIQAQIHSVYPYIPSAALTAIVAFVSDRMKIRGPFVLGFMPIAMAGFIIAIVSEGTGARYAALFLIAIGAFPCSPGIISTLANNHSGYYKRAASLGLQIALGNCGGIVATFVYTADQAPRYVKGNAVVLGLLAFSWFMMAWNMIYCWRENKARAEGKREDNLTKYKLLVESGKTRAPIGDRDPAFRYTL